MTRQKSDRPSGRIGPLSSMTPERVSTRKLTKKNVKTRKPEPPAPRRTARTRRGV